MAVKAKRIEADKDREIAVLLEKQKCYFAELKHKSNEIGEQKRKIKLLEAEVNLKVEAIDNLKKQLKRLQQRNVELMSDKKKHQETSG